MRTNDYASRWIGILGGPFFGSLTDRLGLVWLSFLLTLCLAVPRAEKESVRFGTEARSRGHCSVALAGESGRRIRIDPRIRLPSTVDSGIGPRRESVGEIGYPKCSTRANMRTKTL